ncbi:signal peptidase II [Alicyclobacillaceae bacterium I2511]|nr:signal peptidase II [Alicyclobacillaceae bacterium I2511]
MVDWKGAWGVVYWVAVVIYLLDQGIEWVIRTHMTLHQAIPVIPGILEIDYILNPGAAWGILPGARWFLVLMAVAVIGVVLFIERRKHLNAWFRLGLGLVLGGALGNLTDRVLTGRVVDYVYVQAIHFPVFNLADASIDVGVIAILIGSWWADRHPSQKPTRDVKQ